MTEEAKAKAVEAIQGNVEGGSELSEANLIKVTTDLILKAGDKKQLTYTDIANALGNREIRDSIDGHILKVIIETCYLKEEEIKKMTEICNETFVNFIKTSTGFGTRGASVEDLKTINKYKNDLLEIKASGGIKNLQDAEDMINNGATRLGTSSGVEIMKGEK